MENHRLYSIVCDNHVVKQVWMHNTASESYKSMTLTNIAKDLGVPERYLTIKPALCRTERNVQCL